MPRIEMTTSRATRAHSWDEGAIYDLSADEAREFVRDGCAVYVTAADIEIPETRQIERRGPGRPRKNR